MKLFPIFMLSVFLFLLGFSLGMYFGIDAPSTLISELLGKGNYEIAMFIATLIAALGTATATAFAFYLYFRWKAQQNEIELMATRKELLKTLILIEKSATRLFVSYRFNSNPKQKHFHEEDLSQLFAEFKTNLYLLYTFEGKIDQFANDAELLGVQDDYLDSSKVLYKLCVDLYAASADDYLKSDEVDGDLLRKVSLHIPLDFDGSSLQMNALKEALASEKGVRNDLRVKLSKAAHTLSKENARSGI